MSAYTAIRDDVATSLSGAERDFVVHTAAAVGRMLRVDGRRRGERRPVTLRLTRAENLATAVVLLGAGTRVTCTVAADLLPPAPDRPNEGSIAFTVDISPAANTSYRQATPASTGGGGGGGGGFGPLISQHADRHQKLAANHILRCLERCLLQGGALDTEALCVVPGQYVWKLQCCCTVLDAAGNMTDAAVLACLAAVRHYRKPIVDLGTDATAIPKLVPANLKEPTPLPLHHTPLAISFALFDVSSVKNKEDPTSATAVLIDPTAREELCQTGSLTICMNAHAEICLLDFSGGCELSVADLRSCHAQAAAHIGALCQALETALELADAQALAERMALLQRRPPPPLPPLTDGALEEPRYQVAAASAAPTDPSADRATAAREAASAAEEEAYRRRALDYNLGHVASRVRENKEPTSATNAATTTITTTTTTTSSLLAAMLQSVRGDVAGTEGVAEGSGVATRTTAMPIAGSVPSSATVDPLLVPPPPPPPPPPPAKPALAARTMVDSDDEENTVQVRSEFIAPPPLPGAAADGDGNDDDDLTAAVKSKKKGRRGKTK